DPLYYVLANGRRMRLFDNSALHGEPWIIASELHHGIKDIQLLCGALWVREGCALTSPNASSNTMSYAGKQINAPWWRSVNPASTAS
ncbi:ATP-dependent helicase HrpB, partial [Xylella fastidiosa]|nr:ATP-dependent helicase HrpB [Xylella fastidiosa]